MWTSPFSGYFVVASNVSPPDSQDTESRLAQMDILNSQRVQRYVILEYGPNGKGTAAVEFYQPDRREFETVTEALAFAQEEARKRGAKLVSRDWWTWKWHVDENGRNVELPL